MNIIYKPIGAMAVKKGVIYSSKNIPAVADTVVLMLGIRVTDENNMPTSTRGVKVLINPIGVAPATDPRPNIPFIWKEGDVLIFDENFTYEFLDNGRIGYGVRI